MIVVVNGVRTDVPPGSTISTLIERLGLARSIVAAEVNKQLVPRKEHSTRPLVEGDSIEIVSLVGGG